jgi:hypothetical protein
VVDRVVEQHLMVHVEQGLNLYLVDNLMEQVLVELEPLVKVIMVEMVVEALLNTVVVAVVKVLKVAMVFLVAEEQVVQV